MINVKEGETNEIIKNGEKDRSLRINRNSA